MDCNLLDADINPCSTPAFKGYKRRGWYTMRSNIDDTTIDYTDYRDWETDRKSVV